MTPDLVVASQSAAISAMMAPYLDELTTGRLKVYPRLSLYWEDDDRIPYLVRLDGRDVGFALVREHRVADFREMAEFYIAPAYRRRGFGRDAARSLFARHPGWWHLQILDSNTGAQTFWRRALPAPLRESARRAADGRRFTVIQFHAGGLHAGARP
jgi:predicted acetyltransferase